ncbi:MAG: hypothetical protein AUJ49_03670 [Desulfovibrionaceae bacterium CG1_02_65_16]|nr:MAG: hypothetical protein AUJ49_03670 [Desulfovibrionaceae bacterium CG1_02_65_16]
MFARICCAVLVSVFLCTSAMAAELTPENRQQALRLIEAMGGKDMILQYVRQNMGLVKKLRPDIPADKLPMVEREISAFVTEKIVAPGGLAEQLLPVFAKRFTPKELRELTAFYESPLGQKAVGVMPGALRESREVAQRAAIGMIPELNQRVTDVLKRDAQTHAAAK